VDANQGVLVISEDMLISGIGEIHYCRRLEIYGYVEGDVTAGSVHVHKSGKCYDSMKTESTEVHGTLQGNVTVNNLINIRSSGSVSGNVRYARARGGRQPEPRGSRRAAEHRRRS
jgi:cytoskeletal protein CcmA (bactofilin family)